MSRKRQMNVEGGRPVRLNLRLSDTEYSALRVSAAAMNITVPRYLKESALALSQGETATERAELLKQLFVFQKHLSAIGNNINQIARGVNIDGLVRSELNSSLTELRSTLHDIDSAVSSLTLDGGLP